MANEQTTVPLFVAAEVLTAEDMNLSAGTGVPVFLNTTTRDAGFGGAGEKVLAEGQLCYLSSTNVVQYYDGTAWATVGPSTGVSTAIFNETQANGTEGGTSTSGSFIKRTLNTTVVNNISGCSIASSVITLPAGTYNVSAFSTFYAGTNCRIKLRNTTDSTDAVLGQSSQNGGNFVSNIPILGMFTSAATKDYELQYRVALTSATYGLGIANSFSISEIYSIIRIDKVA